MIPYCDWSYHRVHYLRRTIVRGCAKTQSGTRRERTQKFTFFNVLCIVFSGPTLQVRSTKHKYFFFFFFDFFFFLFFFFSFFYLCVCVFSSLGTTTSAVSGEGGGGVGQ